MADNGNSPDQDVPELDHLGVPDLEALLNPDEQLRFRRLCLPTDAEDLANMVDAIGLHVEQVKANALPATDAETAQMLGDRLSSLVAESDSFDDQERALVRGAVEYFLLTSDADDDLADALGFDDDVRVFNSVVRRMSRPNLVIQLADLE